MASLLLVDVQDLLTSGGLRPIVRKKAALALLRLLRKSTSDIEELLQPDVRLESLDLTPVHRHCCMSHSPPPHNHTRICLFFARDRSLPPPLLNILAQDGHHLDTWWGQHHRGRQEKEGIQYFRMRYCVMRHLAA